MRYPIAAVLTASILAVHAHAQWSTSQAIYPTALQNGIYYTQGNVGIGTTASVNALTVGGNVEIADVGASPELIANGTSWTSSNGVIGDNWSTVYYQGGSITFTAQIVTGNGFPGKAQRVTYSAVSGATTIGGLQQTGVNIVAGKTYRFSFWYRSSTTMALTLGVNDNVVMLAPNVGAATPVSILYTAPASRNTEEFFVPGGGGLAAPGSWLEVGSVSTKEVAAGNLIVRGVLTGGGAAGVKITSAGSVGIGITSPAAPLHVVGPNPYSQLRLSENATSGGVLSALSWSPDNVSLGFDVDFTNGSWVARYGSVGLLRKSGGHLRFEGSSGNSAGSPAQPMNTLFDVDLASGAARFNATGSAVATTITGSRIQFGSAATPPVIHENGTNNLRVFGAADLTLETLNGNIRLLPGAGYVGIGTTPAVPLDVKSSVNTIIRASGPAAGLVLSAGDGTSSGRYSFIDLMTSETQPVWWRVGMNGNTNFSIVDMSTNTLKSQLTRTGDLWVSGSISANGVINAKYQDVAEWVDAPDALPAGTVVTLDREHANRVVPSEQPYDEAVAGVVSAQPGIVLGEERDTRVKVATTGRVRVRVDASSNPIRIGDLLVSSGRRGEAMRSEPIEVNGRRFHQPGTIVGKALEPLATGEGEILVLLTLQ